MPREKWRQLNSQSRADTTISIFEFVCFFLVRSDEMEKRAEAASKLADYKKPLSLAFSAINLGTHLNYFVMM